MERPASSVYGEVFAQRAEDYAQWWLDLPETERERLYAEGEEAIERALRRWCDQEMEAVHSEGLLAKALNFHDRYVAQAGSLVATLGQALRGSAAELEKAAKLYDGSDEAAHRPRHPG